jgi:hypothetical protein
VYLNQALLIGWTFGRNVLALNTLKEISKGERSHLEEIELGFLNDVRNKNTKFT